MARTPAWAFTRTATRRMPGLRSSPCRSACRPYSCGAANAVRIPVRRRHLDTGDIVVWGGPARFVYYGVGHPRQLPRRLRRRSRKAASPKCLPGSCLTQTQGAIDMLGGTPSSSSQANGFARMEYSNPERAGVSKYWRQQTWPHWIRYFCQMSSHH